ncbi:hypothetical protein N0V82_003998 [Gnomoniopsis sp. IMI 355080]|nr:hypothetical protein N0V82_003998 [Gnomoniopsis sp. IMI 355080]
MSPTLLLGPETIQPWLQSLVKRSKYAGCHHVLFPASSSQQSTTGAHASTHHSSSSSSSRNNNTATSRHLHGIEERLQKETAGRLVKDSVPGHIWAYMLTLVVHPDELFADPALAVKMARVAATRAPDAPVTDRDWYRLRYELKGACPDDYPSRMHYEQGQKWLDTVIKRHRLGQTQD